jgi:hypothetical protein
MKRAALYARVLWQRWRDRRAAKIRRQLKRDILMHDAKRFFAGKETAAESRQYRDEAYAVLDAMTTDEILKL